MDYTRGERGSVAERTRDAVYYSVRALIKAGAALLQSG